MRKKIFISLLCCTTLWSGITAQETTSAFNHLAIDVELLSTTGFGMELGTPLSPNFTVRGGFSLLPFSYNAAFDGMVDHSILVKIDGAINIDPAIRSALAQRGLPTRAVDVSKDMNVGVSLINPAGKILVDYYPLSKYTFHITAGVYLGSSRMVKFKGRMDEAVDVLNVLKDNGYNYFDDIYVIDENYQLSGREVMDIRGAVKVNVMKPYFGLGFGRAVPEKRVGVNFDIGIVYHGTPKITSENPNIQKLIDNELSGVVDEIKKIPVYPIISLKLIVRLF